MQAVRAAKIVSLAVVNKRLGSRLRVDSHLTDRVDGFDLTLNHSVECIISGAQLLRNFAFVF